MKKILFILGCLVTSYGFSQEHTDVASNDIQKQQSQRDALVIKIQTVKNKVIEELLLEEKIRSDFDKTLMLMDSLTGVKLKLDRKKQPTPNDNAHLKKINKLLESSSMRIQEIDLELSTIATKRRDVIRELQNAIDTVDQLNVLISENGKKHVKN